MDLQADFHPHAGIFSSSLLVYLTVPSTSKNDSDR
jgi:hypothetical protein